MDRKEYYKEYYQKNEKRIREYQKEYKEKNKEKIREYQNKYQRKRNKRIRDYNNTLPVDILLEKVGYFTHGRK
jgi:hypothetical protein